jgi:hypothetical protein
MFERFLAAFPPVADEEASEPRPPCPFGPVQGWDGLMVPYAGRSFGHGIYRLHDAASGVAADRVVGAMLPRKANRIWSFAEDWLGRQFALDPAQPIDGEPGVVLIDLIERSIYCIDRTFVDFHSQELVENSRASLSSELFASWAERDAHRVPLKRTQVVGYRIPLTLGGQHELDNLEVADAEVELGLSMQISEQVEGLPDGTMISGVRID